MSDIDVADIYICETHGVVFVQCCGSEWAGILERRNNDVQDY